MKEGFTLVEVMVAIAVASLLILGVSSVLHSTVTAAESQKRDSRAQVARSRVVDLLRSDWRGRQSVLRPKTSLAAGVNVLELVTTADSVMGESGRGGVQVTWVASENGLVRKEGGTELKMPLSSAMLEFWDGAAWRKEHGNAPSMIRLILTSPEESVVVR